MISSVDRRHKSIVPGASYRVPRGRVSAFLWSQEHSRTTRHGKAVDTLLAILRTALPERAVAEKRLPRGIEAADEPWESINPDTASIRNELEYTELMKGK
jgi:hypothetical protein